MKKSLLSITLILALTLTSCGNKTVDDVSSTETSETVTSQTSTDEVSSIPSYSAEQNEVSSYLMSNSNTKYDMLYPVAIDGKYGYIDINGNTVIDLVLDDAAPFSEGLASVKSDGLHGYIDLSGDLVIPFEHSYGSKFSNGRAAVKHNENFLYGYIDTSGDIVIDYQFGFARPFNENVANVGVIDDINDIEYFPDSNNIIISSVDNNTYIDINGDILTKFQRSFYTFGSDVYDGLIRRYSSYYNLQGELVMGDWFNRRGIYEHSPYDFSEGLAVYPVLKEEYWDVSDDTWHETFYDWDNWEYIYRNTKGEQVLTSFDDAEPFWEGLARVQKDGVASVIDKTGKVIFNHSGLVSNCSEGCFVYEENDKYGFVNSKGAVAIEAQYDSGTGEFSIAGHTAWYDWTAGITGQFSEGLAYMVKGDKEMYINKRGEVVWEKEREDED